MTSVGNFWQSNEFYRTIEALLCSWVVFMVAVAGAVGSDTDPWTIHDSMSSASLRGIAPIDELHAWACGSGGTILHSSDGGRTWISAKIQGLESVEFRSLHAWDPQTAVVATAGQPAVILKTSDAGKRWTRVYENHSPQAFIDGLRFWDELHGIAFSDPVEGRLLILVTRDGGEHWEEIASDRVPAIETGEAGFAASNSSLCVLQDQRAWIGLGGGTPGTARLLRSTDGAGSWEIGPVSPIIKNESSGIFSVFFRSPMDGIVVGGDYRRDSISDANVALTSDGGLTWTKPTGDPPRGYRSSIVAISAPKNQSHWLACGPTGCEVSRDGNDWVPFSDIGFHALGVGRDQSIWSVGSKGRVGRTNLQMLLRALDQPRQ